MEDPQKNRAWVEVDPAALRANFETVRRCGGGAGVVAMVKADAYGLGARWAVDTLEPLEPAAYGVATVAEGIALRHWGISRDVIVFGPMPPRDVEGAAAHRLTATISDLDALRRWADAAARHDRLSFHVEIDTGMGRAGFDWRECSRWAPELVAIAGSTLSWTGLYTHFHSADSADRSATAVQWERLRDTLHQLPVSSEDLLVHAANSAAGVRWPEYAADLVRPGIYLYGGEPADAEGAYPAPQPVATLCARIVRVRDVPPGTTVGYGATHVSRGWERWATLAIGYGDGLPRALGNRGQALVHGRRVPIVGRISMDMTVVDITGLDAAVDDVAVLIGQCGEQAISVEEVASLAGTINYEILTGFTARLPRVERENE